MSLNSKSLALKSYADSGLPQEENFEVKTDTINTESIEEGSIVFQALAISPDPYMRRMIKSTGGKKIGDLMAGFVAGKSVLLKKT
jgi:NADPH-dependent curcumin reductase CurA